MSLTANVDLDIPISSSTVTVRVIDSTTSLFLDPPLFWEPEIEGLKGVNAPALCFLVSNENCDPPRHILLDLAVRKDWENCAPATVRLIRRTTHVRVEKGIAEILDSNDNIDEYDIRRRDIETIIWSHRHFDHVGDPSTFPTSTELVLGPGAIAVCLPGYPTNPDAMLLDSDVRGRKVREIEFNGDSAGSCQVGRVEAHDYFGDGSFYLLNAPGHCVGHVCALARVHAGHGGPDSDSFVLMGGDACHHAGLLRLSKYLPLSPSLPKSIFQVHPKNSTIEPFMNPSRIIFPDYEKAVDTIRKIQELDAADNVFVVLPHDGSVVGHIPLFPRPINDWQAMRLGVSTRWLFCKDIMGA
ncbi:hypothetical protein ASPVEDRAFT_66609 [Aspergillus versicolor CBS 583.65]|uniref:Metallo-beta-lactamase domain-containing protein n=1 Tax=Aspergillus versicolor CBS 583.65 TaxID=1036611 RepID=A0A1L9Q4N7_ASPVE|nr:uncharacterized protein ASPVEDRAFT_66609 [Aspergillus versicolor CBS 583.65]OJJ08734.1 hypothetical protein ASPVEDRAFT_66609 [Aspergillus versicolor CBS 583.65]